LYAYRREYLLKFTRMPQSKLERFEMLEQLRALENGDRVRVVDAVARSVGVDTEADLRLVRGILEAEEKAHEIVA
jgi:3-deoxy-manno-octulosonate cytidylyltransferase (CMP-KDO synthetase)